jgi:hypothetical protein
MCATRKLFEEANERSNCLANDIPWSNLDYFDTEESTVFAMTITGT